MALWTGHPHPSHRPPRKAGLCPRPRRSYKTRPPHHGRARPRVAASRGWVWILAVIIVVMLLARRLHRHRARRQGLLRLRAGHGTASDRRARCAGRAAPAAELALPDGTPCARISVPANLNHPIQGSLYMVDVLVGPATPCQYILSKLGLLHTFDARYPADPGQEVLGTTPPAQLSCQDAQQMNGATSSAAVVALRHLGYQVKENDLGAQLYQVAPGSPAAAAGLQCNDVVIAVNGQPIHTASDLVAAVRAGAPGPGRAGHRSARSGPSGKLADQDAHRPVGARRRPRVDRRPGPTQAFLGRGLDDPVRPTRFPST